MSIKNVKNRPSNDNYDHLSLAHAFHKNITKRPIDIVGSDDEIETKIVMNLDPHGGDSSFCRKNGIRYPTEIFLDALVREGICVSDPDDLHTKNLVSYYYDTIDRALNSHGVSLRMRHEENPVEDGDDAPLAKHGFQPTAPDLSFKIPTQEKGNNSERLEYETPTMFRAQPENQGGFKFVMTFQDLVEKYVTRKLKDEGPLEAVTWARNVHNLFGFDWNKFREHFSINCKRTQPYARVYSLIDRNGRAQTDENGKVIIFKNDLDKREQQLKGLTYRAIVFQFCLDTNRYFAVTEQGGPGKIVRDHEVEFELQTKKCDYTRKAIKSDNGVTYGEAWAAVAYLKRIVGDAMNSHNVTKHKYSGLSKQERGFLYNDAHNAANRDNRIMPTDSLTVRGRKDLHVVDRLSYAQMVEAVPALKQAHQQLDRQNTVKNRKTI